MTNLKDANLIFFNVRNVANFKNFINFNYFATQNLTKLNFYFTKTNNPYIFTHKINQYKFLQIKLQDTGGKY